MDKGKERNLDVIEIIKKDPSNIKNIDNITEDEYNKIFNYYKEEFDKLYKDIKIISRIEIARDPYNSEFLYNQTENLCMESLKSSTDLLKSLEKLLDNMSIVT